MIITCHACKTRFDDARISTLCPHPLLASEDILKRKALAVDLIGKELRFADQPRGFIHHVQSVDWRGMVKLHGMEGTFPPEELMIVAKESV